MHACAARTCACIHPTRLMSRAALHRTDTCINSTGGPKVKITAIDDTIDGKKREAVDLGAGVKVAKGEPFYCACSLLLSAHPLQYIPHVRVASPLAAGSHLKEYHLWEPAGESIHGAVVVPAGQGVD